MTNRLRLLAILTISIASLASCGGSKNAADDLGVLLLPSSVIIGPAAMSTCTDTVNSATTPSGTAPVIVFPRLRIDWKHPVNSLLVSVIRVTLTGSGIREGKFVAQIAGDEVKNLLGGPTIPANKFVDISHEEEDPTTTPRGKSRGVPPCNLVVSAIPLVDGDKTSSFRAQIKVEVIGTSLSPDFQDQEFVRQTVRASASYIKY